MNDIADLLSWVYTGLFVLLALVVAIDWYRHREPGHGFLALSVGAMTVAIVFAFLDPFFPAGGTVIFTGTFASIIVAPYGLFRFRDTFVPSRPWVRRTIGASVLAALVLTTFVIVVLQPSDQSLLGLAPLIVIVALWIACVGDSIVRFWRESRRRSSVQRWRLRTMSIAFSAILVLLVVFTATSYVPSETAGGQLVNVGTSALIVLIAPLLYAAFSPPQVLRRYWRRSEVELYRQGLEDLLLLSTDRKVLAARGLDSALRLVGADQAVIMDETGEVLAARNLAAGITRALLEAQAGGAEGIVRLGEQRLTAIVLSLPFADGDGLLAVVSGPFSPFFGTDEVRLLGQYALSVTAALERVRLIEALAQASHAKNEFLSRMSHELRTPLNSILGFTQLLEIDELKGDQRDSVERIHRAGEHLLTLINEILDLTRIESGQMTMVADAVPVGSALSEATDLVRPIAAQRGINLQVDEPPAELAVKADRQRLVQVLLNLLSNAAKYSPADSTVDIHVESSPGRVRIHVADRGATIPDAARERLFQPFDRLGAEGSGIEGTGIGLSLSRALVQLMDGQIDVATSDLGGNDFWVDLPIATCPEGTDTSSLNSAPPEANPTAGTILYIEDNSANIDLVRRILRKYSDRCRLDVAMLGTLGLDLAAEHRYDLILLDLNLPDIPGMEVLSRLRHDARTQDLPVVIVSADATQARIDAAMAGGADSYLTKPINVKEFLTTIEGVFAP